MKFGRIASGLAVMVLWTGVGNTLAQHTPDRSRNQSPKTKNAKLPLCPVMGEPIDFNIKVSTDDGPVYFCCESCVKKFKKNPAKYTAKATAQREILKKRQHVQVRCPLTGKPIDDTILTKHGDEKVYFCCADCKTKYEKNPDKYSARLADSYTYQTRCPVMGGEIDPTVYTDLPTGERIYFCCAGCEGKLLANPKKYAPKLTQQGINIDVAKLSAKMADKPAKDRRGHKGHDHP